jgi:hypothetical protein
MPSEPSSPEAPQNREQTSARAGWWKAGIALVFFLAAGSLGWQLRPTAADTPSVVGPSITIVADQPGFGATLGMSLSAGGRQAAQSSKLTLTITPTLAVRRLTRLTVVFSNFPLHLSGSSITPVGSASIGTSSIAAGLAPLAATPARDKDDYVVREVLQPGSQPPPPLAINATARAAIGAGAKGSQLRVALPDVINELPGDYLPALYPASSEFAGVLNLPPSVLPRPAYQPALQAGQSSFFWAQAPLSGFQILSGDPPTLLGNHGWTWNGINNATVLAENVKMEASQQNELFFSGVLLGLAGAALLTALAEGIGAFVERAGRRKSASPKDTIPDPAP